MHDEAGFLAAISETPADDTARLVFADWLDEQDDSTSKTKAAFIRLELQMAEGTEDVPLQRPEALVCLRTLAATATHNWLAVVSRPKLDSSRSCARFTCPGKWELLSPTLFDDRRRCAQCNRFVTFCPTITSARLLWSQHGMCVAVSPVVERRPGDVAPLRLTPEMIERLRAARERGQQLALTEVTPSSSSPPTPPSPFTLLPAPQQRERRAGERPLWKQQRRKSRRKDRNLQRENREDAE